MNRRKILLDKQKQINLLLSKINPDYQIAFLRKGQKGHYRFALKGEFNPRDLEDVKAVFRSVLRGLEEKPKKIQTKVYLPEPVHKQLRRLAYDTRSSLSDIVTEGILAYAARKR